MFERLCEGVKVLTLVHRSTNQNVNPNTELHGDEYIEDARDPFVLPRYRVSSVVVGVSECTQVDEEHKTSGPGRFERRR